jgi:hypothetical protein
MLGGKKPEPVLSTAEAQSAVYQKIKRYVEARVDELRKKNDRSLPADKTARLRGQIAELKHLAALDKPAPQLEADDPS